MPDGSVGELDATSRRSRTSVATPRNISTTGRGGVRAGRTIAGNTTLFADFWGFEPRLAERRAQTKGKVESGVKYVKRNGDSVTTSTSKQLHEWTATVAGAGADASGRLTASRGSVTGWCAVAAFRLEAPLTRVVATDDLVTVDTSTYRA